MPLVYISIGLYPHSTTVSDFMFSAVEMIVHLTNLPHQWNLKPWKCTVQIVGNKNVNIIAQLEFVWKANNAN